MSDVKARDSKYCRAIVERLMSVGHASNAELLEYLRIRYPNLSATTVHRATQRLAERAEIIAAPVTAQGAMRYDSNTLKHDHFLCRQCDRLRDVNLAREVKPIIEAQLDGCRVGGSITVVGICKECYKEEL